jgi:predicted SnoaL-like aldol condensation-catalyzing enzyme
LIERSLKEKTTALQNSIEIGNTSELNLLNPTRYKQHNLNVGDGAAAIAAIHDLMPHDKVYVNVVRAFEDGDYGFVHVDYYLFKPTVAFDIHRYEDGMTVEHWDNLQDTPLDRNKSGRTMTDGKTQAKDHDRTAANKALAQRFTQQILVEQQIAAIDTYFEGDLLMQHNPDMGDGVAEFIAVRQTWAQQGTPARYDRLHKVLGEGNFVLVLSEGSFLGKHAAFYDLYRIDNDKIVEHWDVIEEIPAEKNWKNSNGKF